MIPEICTPQDVVLNIQLPMSGPWADYSNWQLEPLSLLPQPRNFSSSSYVRPPQQELQVKIKTPSVKVPKQWALTNSLFLESLWGKLIQHEPLKPRLPRV